MAKEFIQKLIQKVVPNPEVISQHKNLQFLGDRLKNPNLWHINRRSINMAVVIGLFFAWVPTPTQMAFAAIAALYNRANLPVSVALVWVTNPITMPPLFYFAYRVGLHYLHLPSPADNFEFTLAGIWSSFGGILYPFLFGCLIMAQVSSLAGFIAMDSFWRYQVRKKWQARKHRRASKSG